MLFADRLEVASKAGVADQRLVAPGELTLQRGQDRGAIGSVLSCLLMVAANDVAPFRQRHCLGLIVDMLTTFAYDQRYERRRIFQHEILHQLVRALAYAEDIKEAACLEFGQRLGTDQT